MAPTGNTLVTTNGIHGACTRSAVEEDGPVEPRQRKHSFVNATRAQNDGRENGTDEEEAVGEDGYVVESTRFQGGQPGPNHEAEEESWLAFKAAVILASLASLKIHHPSLVGPARRGTTTAFASVDAFSVGVIENSACVITLSLTAQDLHLHPVASLQQLIVSRLTGEAELPRQLPTQSAPDGPMLLIDFSSQPDAQSKARSLLAQRFPLLLQLCREDRRLRAIVGGHRSYGEGFIHPNLANWFLLHTVHYLDEIRILSSTSTADPSRSTRRLSSVQISPLEKALLLQLSRTALTPQQINAARPRFVQHFMCVNSLPELILRSSQINQSLLALHWFERAKTSSDPNPHKQHSIFELTFTFKQFAHYSYLLSEYLWKKIASSKGDTEDDKDRNPIVCLLMNKNPWMVLIMFAVSLTGASYLNLEISTPINKIKAILTRLKVSLLVTFQRYDQKPQPNVAPDGPLSSLTRILDLSEHCQGLQAGLEAVSGEAGTPDAGLKDPHEILALYEARMRWRDGESKASTAYIVYTSGSTGEPKPIPISHANLLQFLFNYATRFQRKNDGLTRVLQFASYAFDVSVMSIWDTLAHGATICMTTEENLKSDLIGTMISLACTTVDLTPTVLGVLLEDELFRGTEKMAREKVAERWAREGFRLNHVNTGAERVSGELRREFLERGVSVCVDYGPSETTVGVVSSLQTFEDYRQQQQQGAGTLLEDIGRPTGLNEIYILKPQEVELARLGEVGEICVGGGQVAAGYVDHTLPSQRKFIEINLFDQPQPIRLYRTGDLGKLLPTGSEGCGSICCLGRMDSQVKISGVRIELGELEQRLNQLSHRLPSLNDHPLRAIVSKWDDGYHPALLVCFIELHPQLSRSSRPVAPPVNDPIQIISLCHDREHEEWFQGLVAEVKEAVRDDLSAAMIPRHWIPVNRIPISYTGKVDRRALNSLLEPHFRRCESREELSAGRGMTGSESFGRCAQIAAEAWSVGLGRNEEARFKDTDNFVRLGGDSIGMMRAIGTLRRKGMSGVRFSTLAHSADFSAFVNILREHAQKTSRHIKSSPCHAPFDSLTTIEKEAVLDHLDHVHSITKDEIEDCYHISPTQAGIISASLQDEYKEEKVGIYFSQAVYTIHSSFSSESLARNMLRRVSIHPALRTIFVWPDSLPHILQIVLNYSSTRIEKHIDIAKVEREADFLSQLETYLTEDRERRKFKWGRLCMSMKIFECEESGQRRLVWSLHHALSDGLTLEILMEELMSEFSGEGEGSCFSERKQRTQYREFVEAWRTRPAGPKIHQFWQSYLEGVPKHLGSSSTSFTTTQHRSTKWLLGQKSLDELQLAHGITPALALRLMIAIGLFNGGYAGPDVVFGMVRSGREVELDADGLAEEVVGCCVSVLPIRTKIFERKFREKSLLEALFEEKELEKKIGKHQMISMGEVGRRTAGHGEWLDTLVTIQGWRRQEGRRAIKQPPDLIRMPTPYRLSIELSMEEDGQTISMDLFFDKHSFPVGNSHQSAEQLLAHLLSSLSHLSSSHHHQPIQTLLNGDMSTEKPALPSSPVSNGHPLPNQPEAVQQDEGMMKIAKMEEIWMEILGLNGCNPSALAHRSFEELGGDSIGMMRLMNRVKQEFFEDTAHYCSHQKFRTLFQEIKNGIHLNDLVHLL